MLSTRPRHPRPLHTQLTLQAARRGFFSLGRRGLVGPGSCRVSTPATRLPLPGRPQTGWGEGALFSAGLRAARSPPALLGPAGSALSEQPLLTSDWGSCILRVFGRQEAPVGRGVETSLQDGLHSLDL